MIPFNVYINAQMSKSLRIISGSLGSRRIKTLTNTNLKPTPEKLREILFAWLAQEVKEANCLDLFSGSGSLGIEAISNGAKSCTFVEQNPQLFQTLKDNISNLNISDKSILIRTNAETFIRRLKSERFSLIFFDPPYSRDYYSDFLEKTIQSASKKGSIIYIEQSSHEKVIENEKLQILKSSDTGNAKGTIYQVR